MYLIFKIEKVEKGKINKYNKISMTINIISKEETGNIIDEEINKYIKVIRENLEETKRILINDYNQMIYQFHKIENGTRNYIKDIVNKWKYNDMSSNYFTIVKIQIRRSSDNTIKEDRVEELYFDILQNLVEKSIIYERININYRKNKDIVNRVLEIINIVNRKKRNEVNRILGCSWSDTAYEKVEQLQYIGYAIIMIINSFIKKKNGNHLNINDFKNVKLNKKLTYLEELKKDKNRLLKKMKTKNEEKALLKLQDKIDKVKAVIEIERLQKEKNKEKNMYFYNNKYNFIYGKKKINYQKVEDEELPNDGISKEYWKDIYNSNINIEFNEELLHLLNRYEHITTHVDEDITEEEIKQSIKRIPNWKSPGPDMIQGYFIKYLDIIQEYTIEIIQEWYECEYVNAEYCKANTILLYKSGSKDDPKNYRPISCTNMIYKIYTSIIQNKIKKELEKNKIELNKNQYGCKNHVMAAKEALMINNNVQLLLKQNKRKYIEIYYDLIKAYDTVNHIWLIEVLKSYKISSKIINIIKDIGGKWSIKLMYGNKDVGLVNLKNGILQGDTMSPLLFILCIDPIMNKLDEIIKGVEIRRE